MAVPAEPILASTIWTSHLASKAKEGAKLNHRRSGLRTGCAAIDSALDGGLRFGHTTCINAEANTGASEICDAFLVSHLLGSPYATATIIDTAISFDVRRLYRTMISKLQYTDDAAQQAIKLLDRLKIMKVFDLEGLSESMSELRHRFEDTDPHAPLEAAPLENELDGTVGDSEDEEEMLDLLDPQDKPSSRTHRTTTTQESQLSDDMLIIDNISQVVAPLIKSRHAQGQALLSSFMRSLSHLTKQHHLCTVLLSGVTSIPAANVKDESPSIFSSCTLRPAMGISFHDLVDTNLLVHQVRKAVDRAQEGSGERWCEKARTNAMDLVSVIEVLQDRHGGGLGRWAAFNIDGTGGLVEVT